MTDETATMNLRRGDGLRFGAWALLAIAACSLCQCSDGSSSAEKEDPDLELEVPTPVALGATIVVTGKDRRIRLDRVRVDDGSIFRADAPQEQQVSEVKLEALREGTTTFHARADNGQRVQTLSKSVQSAVPDRITFTTPAGCKTPLLFGTDHTFTIEAQRYLGSTLLKGTGGAYPLSVQGAQPDGPSGLTFKTSPIAVKGAIIATRGTSALPFEVLGRDQVTSIALETSQTSVKTGVKFEIKAKVVVAREALCAESFPREVVIETPDVCDHVSTSGDKVELLGRRAGTCTVKVTLTGAAVEAKGSFTIVDG